MGVILNLSKILSLFNFIGTHLSKNATNISKFNAVNGDEALVEDKVDIFGNSEAKTIPLKGKKKKRIMKKKPTQNIQQDKGNFEMEGGEENNKESGNSTINSWMPPEEEKVQDNFINNEVITTMTTKKKKLKKKKRMKKKKTETTTVDNEDDQEIDQSRNNEDEKKNNAEDDVKVNETDKDSDLTEYEEYEELENKHRVPTQLVILFKINILFCKKVN